jgi:hypothetical protein
MTVASLITACYFNVEHARLSLSTGDVPQVEVSEAPQPESEAPQAEPEAHQPEAHHPLKATDEHAQH